MPAQPLSPTMDSRLSVRPLAPTPNFPRMIGVNYSCR